MKSKYYNKRVIIDGEAFDSVEEYRRWCELKLLKRAGNIKDLKRQVKFVLIPAQYENGKCVERECSYRADFVYDDSNGKTHVEDTKGYKTPEYRIKKKLMLYVHGIRIEET